MYTEACHCQSGKGDWIRFLDVVGFNFTVQFKCALHILVEYMCCA